MTTFIGGSPVWPTARSILDEAFATVADPQPVNTQYALDDTFTVEGWVPELPELSVDEIRDRPGLSTDPEVLANLHTAADERTRQAWARTRKKDITAAKRQRRKDNKAWDAAHADDATTWRERYAEDAAFVAAARAQHGTYTGGRR